MYQIPEMVFGPYVALGRMYITSAIHEYHENDSDYSIKTVINNYNWSTERKSISGIDIGHMI